MPMLTQAVAVYFRELREGRGYTQESLATAVDVSKRTVERLERSEGDISVEPFERIITVLGASPEEVNYLATNPSATVEEGKEFARLLLQFEQRLEPADLARLVSEEPRVQREGPEHAVGVIRPDA